MPEPTTYSPSDDFTATDKGPQLNVELANVATATGSIAAALADIRRSDGALQNGIVTEDSLAAGLRDALVNGAITQAAASAAAAGTARDQAQGFAEAAETAANRVDLGALDAAVEATGLDAVATDADRTQTGLDALATAADAIATAADRVQTGLDVTAAETARDAAFVNADVYADIATGRAAVADGVQFQVVSGDEVIRYRRDSSSTQTEVARYPSIDRVRRIANFATEQFSDVAQLARDMGGVFLRVHPAFCYQEASVSASTPANIGDLVGCIRGADGALFAVAFDAARRGTLQQDAAGNYYILTTGAAYIIRTAAGAAWDPTVEWTNIAGWRGGGSAFTWARNTSNSARLTINETLNGGNRTTFYRPDNSQGQLITTPHDPISLPHVLRVVKTLADMSGFYNDNPQRGVVGPVVPFDDTAEVREVGLFLNRTGAVSANYSGGRLYSFFMVPGLLTDAETKMATAELMRVTIPTRTRHVVDQNPVILDFEANSFQWAGATRALTDMTDNGDGSYDLGFVNWWNQERTIIFDVETERAGTSSGTFIEFLSENLANEVIQVDDQAPTNVRVAYRSNVRNTTGFKDVWQAPAIGVKRVRCVLIVKPDGRVVTRFYAGQAISSLVRGFYSIPPTAVRLRPQVTGWKMTRAAFYGRALTDAELTTILSEGTVANVHHIGDSFVGWGNSGFARELETLLAASSAGLLISEDGVGGVAFFEESGNGHAQRFAQTPRQWGKTLIINDGGFEYDRGEILVRTSLLSIIEKMNQGTTKRYIYLEPNPINPVGDQRNTDWAAARAYIKAMIGTRYVDTLEAMFCLEDGSANDRADVAVGLWPRSTRSDSTHYLPAGQVVYAKAALGAMRDLGFVAGTTTLPGVVQTLTATGSIITWDAPADDGGHPVLGYIVQRNTGTWVTQAAQGSATGYTKQYLRTWTAPAAGTYRVAAITRKGTGAYTEVVVT